MRRTWGPPPAEPAARESERDDRARRPGGGAGQRRRGRLLQHQLGCERHHGPAAEREPEDQGLDDAGPPGYPDGIAFAVIFMNICVPLIEKFTQPKVFGYE